MSMITAVQQALTAFWSQFTADGQPVPAYIKELAPTDEGFPYIAMTMRIGSAMDTLPLVATVWCKQVDGMSANKQREEILNQIAAALPHAGVLIPCGAGYLMMRRSSGDFITLMTDEEDPDYLGGRVGYEVTFYNMI